MAQNLIFGMNVVGPAFGIHMETPPRSHHVVGLIFSTRCLARRGCGRAVVTGTVAANASFMIIRFRLHPRGVRKHKDQWMVGKNRFVVKIKLINP